MAAEALSSRSNPSASKGSLRSLTLTSWDLVSACCTAWGQEVGSLELSGVEVVGEGGLLVEDPPATPRETASPHGL